jgi:hypothetical protein
LSKTCPDAAGYGPFAAPRGLACEVQCCDARTDDEKANITPTQRRFAKAYFTKSKSRTKDHIQMKNLIAKSLAAVTLLVSGVASAGWSAPATGSLVKSVTAAYEGTVAYGYISLVTPTTSKPQGCAGNDLAFKLDDAGKAMMSIASAALLSGRNVRVFFAAGSATCSGGGTVGDTIIGGISTF